MMMLLACSVSRATAVLSIVTDTAKEEAASFLKEAAIEKGNCWFYGSTGNHICNQIANAHHGKLHFCAVLQEIVSFGICNPINDPNCVSPAPSQSDIDSAVEISRLTGLFRSSSLLTVQEAAKQALERTIQVELEKFTTVSFIKEASACVHDFAKELVDDVNKCDNNLELQNLFFSLVHQSTVDDFIGCDHDCGGVPVKLC